MIDVGTWPLQPAFVQAIVPYSGIRGYERSDFFHYLVRLQARPRAAQSLRQCGEDDMVLTRLTGRFNRFADPLHPPLSIGKGALLFSKAGTGQDDMRACGC